MVQLRTFLLYLVMIKHHMSQLVSQPLQPPSPPLNIQQLLSSTESVSLQQTVDGIIRYAKNQSVLNNKSKLTNDYFKLNTLNLTMSTVHNPNETTTNQSDNLSSNNKRQISDDDDNNDDGVGATTIETSKAAANKFDKYYKGPMKYVNKSWSNKRNLEKKSIVVNSTPDEWECPNITNNRNLECACDLIYTLRCGISDVHGLELISKALRESRFTVSLLDCTLKNVTVLNEARIFENVSLHGLVISSGEIKRIHRSLFLGMQTPLQTLGLPNNALTYVPWSSMQPLMSLDRLDLSNNKIKSLGAPDFVPLQQLTYLELSENQISIISVKTFLPLKKLSTLKLNENRLGDNPISLKSIELCVNLRELGLKSNGLKGPLKSDTLPALGGLESIELDKNLFTSIRNGAFQSYPNLITLSLRHNQIDVLQDHAFAGLGSLQVLDLAYNGIVAISVSSLKHLPKLLVLDLTHNFLRALTSDLIAPLPSLKELRLDGNDISIVAKTALMNTTNRIHSPLALSLQDNPLACDCNLKPFAEWLNNSSVILSNDLLGAECKTPPHLEGAKLLQIPLDSLTCDNNAASSDKKDAFLRVEEFLKNFNQNVTINKDNDMVRLNESHFAPDYGLILTWFIKLKSNKYNCDSIFIFKKQDWKLQEETFNNLPINCESNLVNGENMVTFIIPETELLQIGERYRFCVTLLQQNPPDVSTILGCSGYIELLSNTTDESLVPQADEPIDVVPTFRDGHSHISVNKVIAKSGQPAVSDISSFEKIRGHSDDMSSFDKDLEYNEPDESRQFDQESTTNPSVDSNLQLDEKTMEMIDSMRMNKNVLPGIGLGILCASIIIFVWSLFKFRKYRQTNSSASTCYDDDDSVNAEEVDNGNKYVKLQATTTL